MEKLYLLPFVIFVLFLTIDLSAQPPRSPLVEFVENAQTIVVIKCLKAGAVDILLRSQVDLEVLHVVKGDPKITTLSLKLRYGLEPGKNYLLRIPSYPNGESAKTFARDTVIPISDHEDMSVLKTLPPRIVVLRTMNMRIDELETIIRRSTSEVDELKTIKGGN
jgi:hypothetical protein